ncbi:hypothetical protein ABPG74_021246 [Tetrahymena malaccensis]
MLKNQGLIESLGAYKLPNCTQEAHHGDHQLSEFCMEDGCSTQLVPVCAFCKFINHKKNKHDIKPVKLIFGELIKDLEEKQLDFEKQITGEDEIEKDLKNIANELAATVEKCNQMIEHINLNLEKYRALVRKEPYERIAIRKLLREVFKSNESEVILRKNVDELRQYTRVDEDGLLKVNDAVSLTALRDGQQKTQLFIKNMQAPLKTLDEVRSYLDISMQQFFLEYDSEDIVSDKGDYTPQQQFEYSKSFSKNQMQQRLQKKEERKRELEKQRDYIKHQMDKHVDDMVKQQFIFQKNISNQYFGYKIINIQCDNKHCSFVDDVNLVFTQMLKAKFYYLLNTIKCPDGKKLNLEMEGVMQELRRYQ